MLISKELAGQIIAQYKLRGEPVAALRDDAVDQRQRQPAATTFLLVSHPDGAQWTVELDGKHHQRAAQAHHLKIEPLFTRDDPGEVERLRGRVALLEKYETDCLSLVRDAEAERDTMRAQVAGNMDLLRLALQFIVNGVELGYIQMPEAETPDPAHDLLPKLQAALSASALPAESVQHQGEPVGVMTASSEPGIAPFADIWPWLEPGTKLYTHADPGEVERLRGLLENQRQDRKRHTAQAVKHVDEIVALRAQLAERDAQLDECITEMQLAISDSAIYSAMTSVGRQRFLQLVQSHDIRRDGALSASTELEVKL
nr:hypothetical protein [Pseudomonas sp. PNPG3]